jgi:hypothetical protein
LAVLAACRAARRVSSTALLAGPDQQVARPASHHAPSSRFNQELETIDGSINGSSLEHYLNDAPRGNPWRPHAHENPFLPERGFRFVYQG